MRKEKPSNIYREEVVFTNENKKRFNSTRMTHDKSRFDQWVKNAKCNEIKGMAIRFFTGKISWKEEKVD